MSLDEERRTRQVYSSEIRQAAMKARNELMKAINKILDDLSIKEPEKKRAVERIIGKYANRKRQLDRSAVNLFWLMGFLETGLMEQRLGFATISDRLRKENAALKHAIAAVPAELAKILGRKKAMRLLKALEKKINF